MSNPVIPILKPGGQQSILGEDAAILFVGGEYIFRRKDEHGYSSKVVAPQDVKVAFTHIEDDSGWMPRDILRLGHSIKGAWYVKVIPDRKTTLIISQGQEKITITIPLPTMIFMGVASSYYVWSTKDKEPTAETKLYQAPLPNVSSEGQICWGNNSPGMANVSASDRAWHNFIRSPFTGHSTSGKSLHEPDDIRCYLLALGDQPSKRKYPSGDLVAGRYGYTLERMVNDKVR